MKLNDILAPYKYFSLSAESDNQGILDFFKTISMDTKSFSIRYDRGNDFFKFAKEQSVRNYIFIMKDEKGVIRGTAAIATIPHIVNGEEKLLGYLGDLRISPLLSPKIRLTWKKCYSDIISKFREIEEFNGIDQLYSAILDENQNAMRSLLKNNDQIIYHELTTYKTFNIVMKKPFALKINDQFQISRANIDEIREFLLELSTFPGMQEHILPNGEDEFKRRMDTWDSFSADSFLVIRNKNQKIVSVCAPHLCQSKKLIIEKMSSSLKFLGKIISLIGLPQIIDGQPINVLYLTYLKFHPSLKSNEIKDIINIYLHQLLNSRKDQYHIISFFTFPEWDIENLPFFYQVTKGRFYQVMSKEEFETNKFLDLAKAPPSFEIGIA